MREYYIAESLKNRHTFAGKLVWIMPLTVVALSIAVMIGDGCCALSASAWGPETRTPPIRASAARSCCALSPV